MACERDIRFELLARLCPNSTGADIRSVCTEAGMYAIRARRKTVTEKDFLESVNKVRRPAGRRGGEEAGAGAGRGSGGAAAGWGVGCASAQAPPTQVLLAGWAGCRSSRATRSSAPRPSTWCTTRWWRAAPPGEGLVAASRAAGLAAAGQGSPVL